MSGLRSTPPRQSAAGDVAPTPQGDANASAPNGDAGSRVFRVGVAGGPRRPPLRGEGNAARSWAGLRSPFVAALLLLAGLVAAAGVRSHQELASARSRQAGLDQEILATRERIAGLEQRVHRLNHDDETLERVAREELGMVRPGDVVLVLPPEKP